MATHPAEFHKHIFIKSQSKLQKLSVIVIFKLIAFFLFCFYYLQRENDKDHKVRLAIGNGVRAEVWREFLDRFGNIKVQEFYASTEGNVGFVNYAGKIGAIGRVNFLHRVNAFLLKVAQLTFKNITNCDICWPV